MNFGADPHHSYAVHYRKHKLQIDYTVKPVKINLIILPDWFLKEAGLCRVDVATILNKKKDNH